MDQMEDRFRLFLNACAVFLSFLGELAAGVTERCYQALVDAKVLAGWGGASAFAPVKKTGYEVLK